VPECRVSWFALQGSIVARVISKVSCRLNVKDQIRSLGRLRRVFQGFQIVGRAHLRPSCRVFDAEQAWYGFTVIPVQQQIAGPHHLRRQTQRTRRRAHAKVVLAALFYPIQVRSGFHPAHHHKAFAQWGMAGLSVGGSLRHHFIQRALFFNCAWKRLFAGFEGVKALLLTRAGAVMCGFWK